MPHKPEVHPIAKLRKELDNVAFFANHRVPDPLQGVNARLPHMLRAIDALEAEQIKLKQAWQAKHQQANMATLRIAYLERMLEMAEENNLAYRERLTRMTIAPPPVWRQD